MFSVELLEGFLDISVEFPGGVFARFVDFGVIKKGHTFVNVLVLVHDYQDYPLVCCEDHMRGVFPEGFDGLLLCLADVVGVVFLVFVVLQYFLGLLVDFSAIRPCSVFTKFITDTFSYSNVLSKGHFGRTLVPFVVGKIYCRQTKQ